MSHANQPQLCAACLAQLHATADLCPPDDRVIGLCDCAGPDAVIVAVAAKQRGEIRHWHAEGPMDHLKAIAVYRGIMEQFSRASMSVHQPAKH